MNIILLIGRDLTYITHRKRPYWGPSTWTT
jgi:hypothetical protein